MTRTWKTLGLYATLAGALAAGPGHAEPPAKNGDTGQIDRKLNEAELKQIRDVVRQAIEDGKFATKADVDGVKTDISSIRGGLLAHKDALEKLHADVDALKKAPPALNQKDLDGLRDQITQLRQDIDALRRASTSTQTAGYAGGTTPAGMGRIELINRFFDDQTVWVNGRSYQLRPGEVRYTEPMPAGTFVYEVPNVRPRTIRTLAANQVFTIQIVAQ